MSTHILFPALDAERPATISRTILTALLREELGYDGLVITDCLEMKAIADTVGTARGAVEALKAGADVVLIGHTLEVQRAAVQAIREAVERGELPEERLNEAVSRVLAAKRRFFSALPPAEGEPWLNPEHDALEQEIARASVTVVKSAPNEGYRLRQDEALALVSAHHSLPRLAQEIRRYQPEALALQLQPALPDEQIRETLQEVASARQCLVATSPPEPWSDTPIDQTKQAELVKSLHRQFGERLVVVALREPYDIRRFPEVENYLCIYGYRPCSLRALADALFGQFVPGGEMP